MSTEGDGDPLEAGGTPGWDPGIVLEALLSGTPVGIAFLDHALRFRYVNAALAAMSGLRAEVHHGRALGEVLPPKLARAVEPLLRRVLETQEPVLDHAIPGGASGLPGRRDWLATFHPVRASDGTLLGVGVTVRDVTADRAVERRRRATELDAVAGRARAEAAWRESEERYRLLVEGCPDAIWINRGGRIVYANRAALHLLGATRPDEVLGLTPFDLILPDYHSSLRARIRRLIEEGEPTVPLALERVVRRDGTVRDVEIAASAFMDHGVRSIQVVLRDVTERQRAEEALRRAHDELEVRVAERTASLAEAYRRLQEAEQLKADLTNMVVHDLKNPVNGIAMMVALALRKGQELPEGQRSYLLQVERSCREMMRLIQNLLEISKIEEGKMPVAREPIVLAAVADEVAAEYAPVAEQMGRRLDVHVDTALPHATGDRMLLKRVLVNLVVNALRHSGSSEVRVEAAPDAGAGEITIRVIDEGRGIPDEAQAYVFEKFRSVRGDPGADTGLGLPFCKLAVERMGGRIALRSAPGQGTEFAVTLPLEGST